MISNHLLVWFVVFGLINADTASISPKPMNRGRQWVGQLNQPSDCTFPIDQSNSTDHNQSPIDQVSLCNFTTSAALLDGVHPWRKGLASFASWLGGPTTDASNSTDGGYVFFETSSVQQLPGIEAKAWLKSPVYRATTPTGNCFRFAYNVQGVSASRLRLLRVQMVPLEGQSGAPSQPSTPSIVNSILMPTTASDQPSRQNHQHQRVVGSEEKLAAPWIPYRNIIANHTAGWQEVVDEVWLSSDSTSGRWLHGHVTYSSPYPHAFIFEAVPDLAFLQYRGYVAVDNLQFSSGACECECEFNTDFCKWSNEVETDDFDWSLSRGSLWTSTGPIRDQLSSKHSFNFGGYAFIDSRLPHFAGSRASLTSDVLPATVSTQSRDALCFIFWVHMYGAGVGRLRVLQKRTDNSTDELKDEEEIWRLSEIVARDSWYRAQITVASSTPFRISLEATVGETGYGDIAVDSFRIENGSCPGLPEWAVTKGVDCTFQHGNCGWVLTNSQPGIASMWTRSGPDILAGRPDGHLQQNVLSQMTNSYMLFDTYQNGHKAGSRGFVSSPLQASTQPQCLSFWFYMASSSPVFIRLGALEVVLFEPNVTSNTTPNGPVKPPSILSTTLWRLENHQQEKWLSAQVSFVAPVGGYVSFVGTRGEGVRGIIAIDDVTLFKGPCQIKPLDASVSPVDCTFDHHLCGWSVDSQTLAQAELVISPEVIATTPEGEGEQAVTTEMMTTVSLSRLDSSIVSEKKSTFENELPAVSSGNLPPPALSESDDAVPSTTTDAPTTTDANIVSFAQGGASPELIPSSRVPAYNETIDASLTSRQSSVDIQVTTTSEDDIATVTNLSAVYSTSTTISTSVTDATSVTTAAPRKTNSTNGSIRLNNNSSTNNKDLAMRGVSGLYDEITSFGSTNTIEVISTSRDGATKSIIISQPGRTSRFKRSGSSQWVGYNWPRRSRIVHYRNNHRQSDSDGVAWRRPMPVPHWLRSRQPALNDEMDHNVQSQITPYAAYQSLLRTSSTPPSKLFAISNTPRPVQPIAEFNNVTQPLVREDPRWTLAGKSSLYGVRDHTFQLTEGGYVYFEGKGKATTSRLFSPVVSPRNVTQCLSFFFAMAYNSPNSTLTVYRLNNGPLEELWRVTSIALDRSVGRGKSTWIPARVPIPPNDAVNQTIVVEGFTDSGGIALDDIRLQQISCTSRP